MKHKTSVLIANSKEKSGFVRQVSLRSTGSVCGDIVSDFLQVEKGSDDRNVKTYFRPIPL